MKALELTGARFGLLTVTRRAQTSPVMWGCICDCGNVSVVSTGRLRSGNTRSCGCRKAAVLGESTTTHGMAGTRTHRIWKAMLTRTRNPNTKQYKDYGGRGITVCKRWLKFENFIADMGVAPDDRTLDRLKGSRGYSKANCRWATRTEQNQNARSNIRVVINGDSQVVAEWARRLGTRKSVIYGRIKRGWDAVDACTRPVRKGNNPRFVPIRGKVLHIQED